MQIQQNVAKDMLKNISDPKLREVYGSIISGKIVAFVHCLSDNCKGRVIATIDDTGKVDETAPVLTKALSKKSQSSLSGIYSSGLEGSRQRLDGQMGFRCYCGNNSILCEEEKGIISPARPSSEDLQKIANRLSKRKTIIYSPKNGKTNIDGFVIEEVKA
jgi:hypothetical protein